MANDDQGGGRRGRRPVLTTVGGLTAAEAEEQNSGTRHMQQHAVAAPPQVLAAQGLLDMSTRAHTGGSSSAAGGVRLRAEQADHLQAVVDRLRGEKPGHHLFGKDGPSVQQVERSLLAALQLVAPDGWQPKAERASEDDEETDGEEGADESESRLSGNSVGEPKEETGPDGRRLVRDNGGLSQAGDSLPEGTMAAPSPTGGVVVPDDVHGKRVVPGLDHLRVPPDQFNGPPPASPEMSGDEPPAPLLPGPDGVTGSPPVVPLSPSADEVTPPPGGVLGGGGGKASPTAEKRSGELKCPECGAGPFGSQRGLDGHMGAKHKGKK